MIVRRYSNSRTIHSLAIFVAGGIGGLCPDVVHLIGCSDTVEQAVLGAGISICYVSGICLLLYLRHDLRAAYARLP